MKVSTSSTERSVDVFSAPLHARESILFSLGLTALAMGPMIAELEPLITVLSIASGGSLMSGATYLHWRRLQNTAPELPAAHEE